MKKKLLLGLILGCGIFLGTQSNKVVLANEIDTSTQTSEISTENTAISSEIEESSVVESTTIIESTPVVSTTINESTTIVESSNVLPPEENTEEEFDLGVWLEKTFTAEFFTNLGSIGVGIFALLKMYGQNKTLTTSKILTPQEIADLVLKEMQKKENNNFGQYIAPLMELVKTNIASQKDLAKIISLMIENTPQSRLAILEIIEKMGSVETSFIEENKQKIYTQIEEEKKEKEATIEELDNIEKETTEGRY